MDQRYKLIKERLEKFSVARLRYLRDNIDKVCFDTYNYDEQAKTYCPLAILMRLDKIVPKPTNENITQQISWRFNPVNVLKGVKGEFYTTNRKRDLLSLCDELIKSKKQNTINNLC